MNNYNKVIEALLINKASKATMYLSPKEIIRVTRTRFTNPKSGKKYFERGNVELTLTIGKPNYAEREFIKLCLKAKEPFPIKKIQFKI